MKYLSVCAVFLATCGLCSFGNAEENPLAPAAAGKIECFNPDDSTKTCDTLTTYRPREDGTFDEGDTMVLLPKPRVTVELKGVAFVKDGMICQKILSSSLDEAKFFLEGQPVGEKRIDQAAPGLLSTFKALIDKTSCMRSTLVNGRMKAEFLLDGIPVPTSDQYWKWVGLEEGYKLQGQ